jgi:hypothetical protein
MSTHNIIKCEYPLPVKENIPIDNFQTSNFYGINERYTITKDGKIFHHYSNYGTSMSIELMKISDEIKMRTMFNNILYEFEVTFNEGKCIRIILLEKTDFNPPKLK